MLLVICVLLTNGIETERVRVLPRNGAEDKRSFI